MYVPICKIVRYCVEEMNNLQYFFLFYYQIPDRKMVKTVLIEDVVIIAP